MTTALLALTAFLQGNLSGVFLGSALVEHAERSLGGAEWLAYKQAKERVFGPVMPVLFALTMAASIALAAATSFQIARVAVLVCLAAALVVTVAIHLPLNKTFQRWSPASMPSGWSDGRSRWRNWNWMRCAAAMSAFAITVSAG